MQFEEYKALVNKLDNGEELTEVDIMNMVLYEATNNVSDPVFTIQSVSSKALSNVESIDMPKAKETKKQVKKEPCVGTPENQEWYKEVPVGKVWILHDKGFSLVDVEPVNIAAESYVLKLNKLPPESSIDPTKLAEFKKHIEALKNYARSYIFREVIDQHLENVSTYNALAPLPNFSWSQTNPILWDFKSKKLVKLNDILNFSAKEIFIVNPVFQNEVRKHFDKLENT